MGWFTAFQTLPKILNTSHIIESLAIQRRLLEIVLGASQLGFWLEKVDIKEVNLRYLAR